MNTTQRTFNKADLCYIFGLFSAKSNKVYYSQLKKIYFTEEAMKELGITPERYSQITAGRTFSFNETKKIIEYFNIQPEEMTESY